MKLLLDEDVPVQLLDALRQILSSHDTTQLLAPQRTGAATPPQGLSVQL